MCTVVWPIFNSSPNGVHHVATGVDDSPKLAHQGHVQLGMRELTILASCSQDKSAVNWVLQHRPSSASVQLQPADKMLATMSSSASASSLGSRGRTGKEGVVFRRRGCSSAE